MNTLISDAAHMLVSGHVHRISPPAYECDYGRGMEFGKRMAGKLILKNHCRKGERARRQVRKEIRWWVSYFKADGKFPGKAVAS